MNKVPVTPLKKVPVTLLAAAKATTAQARPDGVGKMPVPPKDGKGADVYAGIRTTLRPDLHKTLGLG